MTQEKPLNLANLIRDWLRDNDITDWKVIKPNQFNWAPKGAIGIIRYNSHLVYECVYIYDTKVEFAHNYGSHSGLKTKTKPPMDRGLIIDACSENFMALLSNRLYMLGLGFEKALESRERNQRNSDN